MKQRIAKVCEASGILHDCRGKQGMYASPDRYDGMAWTRDQMLASQPALSLIPGGMDLAATHLRSLAKRQRPNGQIPILFLDGLPAHLSFLKQKVGRSLAQRRVSFMLQRYLQGQLWNLTPGTTDSELMFAYGLLHHADCGGDPALVDELQPNLLRAVAYLEGNLLDEERVLMRGADWRDTMDKELKDQTLLSNNSLLYAVYTRMCQFDKAERISKKLLARRDQNSLLVDYEGATSFDPLGGALAVLNNVVPPSEYPAILRGFASVDTPNGVTIRCKHNAGGDTAEEVCAEHDEIERTGGVVVWPFVGWHAEMAARDIIRKSKDDAVKLAASLFAKNQRQKLLYLNGFREWYSPDTGKGWGAKRQLWSAALCLRALAKNNDLE